MKYFKKCEEFYICGSKNNKKEVFAESGDKSLTLFQIIVKGRGRLITTFDTTTIDGGQGDIVDCKSMMGKDRVLVSDKDSEEYYEVYGFNPLDPSEDWDAKKIISSFKGNSNSWIICFDGSATINGKIVKKFDYAKLEDKNYEVKFDDALLGVFTKL
jgi:hypothetical protein|tara:strand:+ start:186 stop:656 length:471 start_codon:yes stop_codon:yes gene_type:complete